jgi:hypothetical protein
VTPRRERGVGAMPVTAKQQRRGPWAAAGRGPGRGGGRSVHGTRSHAVWEGNNGGERCRQVGPAQGTVKILIYLNNFQMSLNCFDQKLDLPSSKIFK